MIEKGTVGTANHYWPLGQQRINNNDKTHPLDATISHMKGSQWRRRKCSCSGGNYEEDTGGCDWMMAEVVAAAVASHPMLPIGSTTTDNDSTGAMIKTQQSNSVQERGEDVGSDDDDCNKGQTQLQKNRGQQ